MIGEDSFCSVIFDLRSANGPESSITVSSDLNIGVTREDEAFLETSDG
jgi:hypothetical protein